jgi:hypothetical protein
VDLASPRGEERNRDPQIRTNPDTFGSVDEGHLVCLRRYQIEGSRYRGEKGVAITWDFGDSYRPDLARCGRQPGRDPRGAIYRAPECSDWDCHLPRSVPLVSRGASEPPAPGRGLTLRRRSDPHPHPVGWNRVDVTRFATFWPSPAPSSFELRKCRPE